MHRHVAGIRLITHTHSHRFALPAAFIFPRWPNHDPTSGHVWDTQLQPDLGSTPTNACNTSVSSVPSPRPSQKRRIASTAASHRCGWAQPTHDRGVLWLRASGCSRLFCVRACPIWSHLGPPIPLAEGLVPIFFFFLVPGALSVTLVSAALVPPSPSFVSKTERPPAASASCVNPSGHATRGHARAATNSRTSVDRCRISQSGLNSRPRGRASH